jgi:hypothetical protein
VGQLYSSLGELMTEIVLIITESRSGSVIRAPKWFTKKLPKSLNLDGELLSCVGSHPIPC